MWSPHPVNRRAARKRNGAPPSTGATVGSNSMASALASCLTSMGLDAGGRGSVSLLEVDGTAGGLACPAGVAYSCLDGTTTGRRKASRWFPWRRSGLRRRPGQTDPSWHCPVRRTRPRPRSCANAGDAAGDRSTAADGGRVRAEVPGLRQPARPDPGGQGAAGAPPAGSCSRPRSRSWPGCWKSRARTDCSRCKSQSRRHGRRGAAAFQPGRGRDAVAVRADHHRLRGDCGGLVPVGRAAGAAASSARRWPLYRTALFLGAVTSSGLRGWPRLKSSTVCSVARLLVRMTTVFLKSTVRPSPSVSMPLSNTW